MSTMFDDAFAFNQNLGKWYVVLNSTVIAPGDVPGIVGRISAQNSVLDDHLPKYKTEAGGDSARFSIVTGNLLNMTSADNTKSTYQVHVAASGSNLFEDGSNSRVLVVTVTDGQANQAPIANAGSDLQVNERTQVTLDGTRSSDDDGTVTGYSWTQTAGTNVDLSNAAAASPTFVAPQVTANEGLTFSLTVTDDDGAASTADTVTITVQKVMASNRDPVADAGDDLPANENTPVQLDGSDSVDPDGDPLTYSWVHAGGLAVTDLTGANTASPMFTAPEVGTSGGTVLFRLTVSDGNGGSDTDTVTITVNDAPVSDTTPPTPTVASSGLSDGGTTHITPIRFTVTFDEAVTNFTKTGVVLDGTANPTLTEFSGSGRTYAVVVTPGNDGTVILDIPQGAARDLASNPSNAAVRFTVNYDGTAPAPTITSDAGDSGETTSTSPVSFTVTFDEGVTGFGQSGVGLGGTARPALHDFLEVSADTYTFTVYPGTGGTVILNIPAGAARDTASNPSEAAATFTITYDAAGPVPTVTSGAGSSGAHTNESTIGFTVRFNEDVTGFDGSDVDLGGTAATGLVGDFAGSDAGPYTFTVVPTIDGTVIVDIRADAARDSASNPSVAAATFTVNYDGTAPAPAVTAAELTPEGTPLQDGDYTTKSPIAFTVEFDETVTGFTADDARLGGTARPALRDFTDSGNGDGVYTFEAHPRRDGTVTVEIRAGAAQDSASNPSEAADTFTVNRDTTGPRPTITSDAGRTTSSTPIDFSVSFDEPVTTFVAPDIVLGGPAAPPNGSVGDFDGSGDSYTFTVTPEPVGGELTVEIRAGAVPDARGNDNFRAAYTTTYVPAAPTVASLKTGELDTILITLTETVLGVTFAGFTVSGVASDPDVISATPDGKVITLGLDGNMLDSDRPRVAYDSAQGGITDADGIPLADFERAVTNDLDTTPPAVRSAVARGTDGISVSFSEKITGSTDAADWTLSGAPGITINTATLQGSSSSSVRLGLSGDIPDGKPELTLRYAGSGITDPAGNPLAEISDIPVRHPSDSRTRTSSVPVLDIHSVMESPYAQHVPKEILDAVGSSTHDPDAPIPPVAAGDPLEYPISINGHGYLLGGARNTLEPQTVRAGEETTITFTVYDSSPITHFTMYMNLHGSDDQYSDSDTYVRYDAGSVLTADPHGLIESATVAIDADGDIQVITFEITFAGAMEQTNIVARLWNADLSLLTVQVLDAFEVVAASESAAVTTTTPTPDAIVDPEPGDTATAESGVGPGSAASPGTAMDVLKRWAGFAPEAATDAELLEALGLDYPGADIPGWVMTELGPLVAKGHVTISEFIAALEYVLGEDA